MEDKPNGQPPKIDLENLPLLLGKPPTPPRVWVRRIFVWALTLGFLSWSFASCYKVLSRRPEPASKAGAATVERTLPDSTGEYKHAKARGVFFAGRKLLRAGDLSGVATMQQVIQLFPESPQARQAMMVIAATQRYQINRPQKALRTYTDFVRAYPDDAQVPRAVQAIRDISANLGRPDNADTLLRFALTNVKDDAKATARIKKLLGK